nr:MULTISPECIES: YdcH family protein [Lysobacter]
MAQRVIELKLEHRDLDAAIERLQDASDIDDLTIKRLKKRRLQLKDAIAKIESAMIPDEPA